ncbi:hypothetical protein MHO82_05610 [Vibrio sp. Of7-15]|uniref:hypothetical protein n=1 Tax=Vibrio sp. Of7-15 TaxID=2724879 RepID=UPI001EF3BAD1|nr:hypothetical protein [Vibrio sp. Of7-15]MCG7496330.1 hypothetical protein [Vibrio sp. Of7-15]
MEIYQTLMVAIASGFASAVGTTATIKTDIRWIKQLIDKLEERVMKLEKKTTQSCPIPWG